MKQEAHRCLAWSAASLAIALCACAPEPDPASKPAAEAVSGYHGAIIDTHAHLRLGEDDAVSANHPKGTAELLRLDDAAGVEHSALIVIARQGQLERTRAQNDAVVAASRQSQGRFYPVVSVHPADGAAALAELDRVAALGAKVVKLHPNTQNFDVSDPAVASVVQKCGELGLIVLFDSYKPWDPGEIGKLLLLSIQQPKTRFVLAHMGFSGFRDTVSFAVVGKLGMGGNVWFDVSAIATTYADSPLEAELVWTLRQVGIQHVLFGSDWPVDTPAVAVDAVRRLGLTPEEQQGVLHDNAAELLGL
jgi:predicted TIM-barrel fold metal-dependent hydrolase